MMVAEATCLMQAPPASSYIFLAVFFLAVFFFAFFLAAFFFVPFFAVFLAAFFLAAFFFLATVNPPKQGPGDSLEGAHSDPQSSQNRP
jgi:hypothetical protein